MIIKISLKESALTYPFDSNIGENSDKSFKQKLFIINVCFLSLTLTIFGKERLELSLDAPKHPSYR